MSAERCPKCGGTGEMLCYCCGHYHLKCICGRTTVPHRRMKNPRLKRCPFCGGKPKWGRIDEPGNNEGGEFIECQSCGCTTPLSWSLKDDCKPHLALIWNSRPEKG